jgi:hypothetical protein
MVATSLTSVALTALIRPIVSDLYNGAKGKVQEGLSKWSTDEGIKNIALTLAELDKVKTIWSGEDETPLKSFYYPSRIQHLTKKLKINSIQDLPNGNLVIEGIVGQGKSIFMRYLAASALASPSPTTIPVFIELRSITPKRSLIDSISIYFDSISINFTPATLEYLASSEKIVLILDGFDEIPDECISDVLLELGVIQRKYPTLKIIVSSRPRSHIQNSSGFKVVKLVPLVKSDYDPFVAKLITSPAKRFDVVTALKDCAESIKGLVNTPLMLTLVVMIYQTEKEIPSSLSEFFDKLFGVVFTRHDKLKAGFNRQHHSGLSESRLKRFFEAFCFMAVQNKAGRSMSNGNFNKAFDAAKKFTKEHTCENENFRKDIIKVACLMLEEGIDTVTYLHKSILDYHAAAFIRDLSEAQSAKIYASIIKNYRQWEHVLQFLKTIDPLRYSKYYILGYLPAELNKISNLIDNNDSNELIRFLDKIMPSAALDVKGFRIESFTRPSAATCELYVEIADAFPLAIFNQCAHMTSHKISKAAQLDGYDTPERNEKLSLSIRSILNGFGDEHIWSMLKTIQSSTIQVLEKAATDINNEIQEEDLLDEIMAG